MPYNTISSTLEFCSPQYLQLLLSSLGEPHTQLQQHQRSPLKKIQLSHSCFFSLLKWTWKYFLGRVGTEVHSERAQQRDVWFLRFDASVYQNTTGELLDWRVWLPFFQRNKSNLKSSGERLIQVFSGLFSAGWELFSILLHKFLTHLLQYNVPESCARLPALSAASAWGAVQAVTHPPARSAQKGSALCPPHSTVHAWMNSTASATGASTNLLWLLLF